MIRWMSGLGNDGELCQLLRHRPQAQIFAYGRTALFKCRRRKISTSEALAVTMLAAHGRIGILAFDDQRSMEFGYRRHGNQHELDSRFGLSTSTLPQASHPASASNIVNKPEPRGETVFWSTDASRPRFYRPGSRHQSNLLLARVAIVQRPSSTSRWNEEQWLGEVRIFDSQAIRHSHYYYDNLHLLHLSSSSSTTSQPSSTTPSSSSSLPSSHTRHPSPPPHALPLKSILNRTVHTLMPISFTQRTPLIRIDHARALARPHPCLCARAFDGQFQLAGFLFGCLFCWLFFVVRFIIERCCCCIVDRRRSRRRWCDERGGGRCFGVQLIFLCRGRARGFPLRRSSRRLRQRGIRRLPRRLIEV